MQQKLAGAYAHLSVHENWHHQPRPGRAPAESGLGDARISPLRVIKLWWLMLLFSDELVAKNPVRRHWTGSNNSGLEGYLGKNKTNQSTHHNRKHLVHLRQEKKVKSAYVFTRYIHCTSRNRTRRDGIQRGKNTPYRLCCSH